MSRKLDNVTHITPLQANREPETHLELVMTGEHATHFFG